jgi:succinoglycan biosynthesis transport protein ExoP
MNQPIRLAPPGPDVPFIQSSHERPFDWMPDLLLFVRRRWASVVVVLLICLALGAGYILYATPKYTATAALLVDTKSAAFLRNQPTINDAQYINGLVESQAEVVQSDGVARAVVRKLHLADDEAFLANGHGRLATVIDAVRGLFAPARRTGADQRETLAAALLQKLLSVTRLGESYVLDVSVTTRDPHMSARLANAVAAAYAQVGLDVKNQATRRAGGWMDDRLAKLRVQASQADAKVQAYKAAHNIVDTDKGLLDQHELSELGGQLVLAHAATAQAKARYDQIQSILKNGTYQGSVMDSLSSDVINKLREQYLSDQRRHTQWAAEFGPNNGTVRKLEQEMAALRRSIESELARIADGYRSAYQSAAAGEQALQHKLHQLTERANGINEQLVTMRSLQNQADAYRALYASFLQRYTQALQDESFPVAEAEVVAQAQPPAKESWPNPRLILAAAAVLGLGAGFGAAILRDSFDRGIRTAAQLRAALGVDCLGLMPLITGAGATRRHRRRDAARNVAARSLANWPPLLRLAGTAPMSQSAEAMRRTRARIDQLRIDAPGGRVIGCVSARSGEGKSTISANLAASMARSGKRTLLIDWDLRKQSLTTALEAGALPGFIDIVTRPGDAITDVLWQDPVTQLQFLPAGPGAPSTLPCAVDLLHTPATQALIDTVRRYYDYIVVDLPAMEAANDADSAAAMVDAALLVVEWGRTDIDLIADCLAGTHAVPPRLIGAVLNKVELRNMRRYGDYGRARGASYAPVRIGSAV